MHVHVHMIIELYFNYYMYVQVLVNSLYGIWKCWDIVFIVFRWSRGAKKSGLIGSRQNGRGDVLHIGEWSQNPVGEWSQDQEGLVIGAVQRIGVLIIIMGDFTTVRLDLPIIGHSVHIDNLVITNPLIMGVVGDQEAQWLDAPGVLGEGSLTS